MTRCPAGLISLDFVPVRAENTPSMFFGPVKYAPLISEVKMSPRSLLIAPALLGLALLASCQQPMFTLNYTLPPELDISKDIKIVGVIPFTSPSGEGNENVGMDMSTKIEEDIQTSQYFQLIDRTSLQAVLDERSLSFADFAEGAQKDLKLKGVDAIITGSVSRFNYERKPAKIRVLYNTRVYNRITMSYIPGQEVRTVDGEYVSADVTVAFRMVNTKTGVLIAVKSATASWDSRGRRHFGDQLVDIPPSELPDRGKAMSELVLDVSHQFLKKIIPQTYKKTVMLVERGPDSQRGIKFATSGLPDKALEAFIAAVASEPPGDGAWYDQGVILEGLNKLDDAEKAYSKAIEINPDESLYMQALKDVREIKAQKNK